MGDKFTDAAYDIYSIYRTQYPPEKVDLSYENKILEEIDRSLLYEDYSVAYTGLGDIIKTYIQTHQEVLYQIKAGTASASFDINERILTFFKTFFSSIASGFTGRIKTILNDPFGGTWKRVLGDKEKGVNNLMNELVSRGFISKESADYLSDAIKSVGLSSGFSGVIALLATIITLIFSTTAILMGDFMKNMNSKFTPNVPDIGSLIQALHIAPEITQDINKKMRQNGFDDEDIKILKIASYRLLDVETIRICFLRGIITQDETINRLGELGYTPARQKEIMSTWNIIPSPQDLLYIVGKEGFESDQIRQFGLDAEFPSEQLEYLRQQGYSDFWSMKYWIAHWDYPSEGRVLELYHRGIIDDKDLDAFYRVIEMPPYWRDKLKKASYSLYTRVDLRRMHDMGLITENDVYTNFRSEGYDDEHAQNMTKFYLKYNELNDKDLSMSQIKNAYEADIISKDKAVEALTKLQYSTDQALFILELVEYDEMIKIQKLRIKSIAKMYKSKEYDKNKVRGMLSALGVESKWIDVYFTQWDEEIILEEKLPELDTVLSWYQDKTIDKKTFLVYMRKYKFSESTINVYAEKYSPDNVAT